MKGCCVVAKMPWGRVNLLPLVMNVILMIEHYDRENNVLTLLCLVRHDDESRNDLKCSTEVNATGLNYSHINQTVNVMPINLSTAGSHSLPDFSPSTNSVAADNTGEFT